MHLHFTQSLEPLQGGGLGFAALGLHQGLLEAGYKSSLLSTKDSDYKPAWPQVTQYLRSGPTKLFYSNSLRRECEGWVNKADVVHGHGFYVYPNFTLGRHARRLQKPMVYHAHGFFDPWILARSKLKKGLVNLLFENANFRHANLWRALSEKEVDQIRDYGIKAPIEVIPNGVELPQNRRKEEVEALQALYPKQRRKRLLFLSRVHPKKGLDLLISSWTKLDNLLTADWEIAVFGPDEGGHQADLEETIIELGLNDQIRFYGSVSGQDKEAAFRSGDIFILPSYSEGFPMAVLEACSYGLPVIQTTECNFPELSRVGGAWECQPDAQSLKLTLQEALSEDDSELSQRGAIGRNLVEESYSWKSIARQLVEACQRYC